MSQLSSAEGLPQLSGDLRRTISIDGLYNGVEFGLTVHKRFVDLIGPKCCRPLIGAFGFARIVFTGTILRIDSKRSDLNDHFRQGFGRGRNRRHPSLMDTSCQKCRAAQEP